jgi:hypothetical protein
MSVFMTGAGAVGSVSKMCVVTITGDMDVRNSYAIVEGTTYISAAELELAPGTEVIICVGYVQYEAMENCYVSLNGMTVSSGPGSYTYTVEKSCNIVFKKQGTSSMYYCAEITTS